MDDIVDEVVAEDASPTGALLAPTVWINRLKFSDGTIVNLQKDDIIVIVGPNNGGKSACLRGIRDILQKENAKNPVVIEVSIVKEGAHEDLVGWLDTFTIRGLNDPANPVFQAMEMGLTFTDSREYWKRPGPCLFRLGRFFCHMLTADERLTSSKPIVSIAITREPPRHPIHYLLRNDDYEKHLSAQFRKAFGVDLIVHRNAGSEVPLLTGERPVPREGDDRVSHRYMLELDKLDQLQNQGDGMRSFASVLLFTLVGRESILLIDEPEAFLHPPQARLLGRTLVTDKPAGRQVFISTHSGDVLRGVLDADKPNVRVLRIRRQGSTNVVKELDSARIQELWKDPLLRYSNILDGLFHEKVIIGESDSDARFYSAVMDAVVQNGGEESRRADLMFTHCGGKDRLPTVVRALRAVEVPVKAVADLMF